MSDPKVSIIIPIYNGSLLINRCLDSVFNQRGNFDLEVIVIDDGSTDNSAGLVCNYHHPVRLLQQTNLGPAAARNEGIRAATGKYIAFLDSDDYWLPGFLEHTVGFLEKNSVVAAVSVGQVHKFPGKPDKVVPLFLKSKPEKDLVDMLLPDFFEFWAEHNHVCTGSVLMRTVIVKLTGGQRSELHITEDLEFWAYLATFGNWGFIPKVLYVSDGIALTKQMGWLKKNEKRWNSVPTIEHWESRILKRLNQPAPETYLKVRGNIVRSLTYTMIISGRYLLAQKTILSSLNYLPKDQLSRLLSICARSTITWFVVARLLKLREIRRKL